MIYIETTGQGVMMVPRTYMEADYEGTPADFNNDFSNDFNNQ